MAFPLQKRGQLTPIQGRPKQGALSTYSADIVLTIKSLRSINSGWGAISIRVELEYTHGYNKAELPSINAINRYLKEQGFISSKAPKGEMPMSYQDKRASQAHECWEMDAQGAVHVAGLGYQSLINIKDQKTRLHCMSFPISVKNVCTKPSGLHYFWALRLAFEKWGLPKSIQVDKDSVFISTASASTFPSKLHLWLIGLGVQLCFIDVPPSKKQAIVERSHQTMERQVIKGKTYANWGELFHFCQQRMKRLNEHFPNRSLGHIAPLKAFPKARKSDNQYTISQEKTVLDLQRIYDFLAECSWHRKVSSIKVISLAGQAYYLKTATPRTYVHITCCAESRQLVFRNDKEQIISQQVIKDFDVKTLMGTTTEQLLEIHQKIINNDDFVL